MANHTGRGCFKKGVSGNPGGRPKRTAEEFALIQACKAKSPGALKVIESLMYEADKDAVRLAAAIFFIERGFGKPPDRIESPHPLEGCDFEVLLAIRDYFKQRIDEKKLLTNSLSNGGSS